MPIDRETLRQIDHLLRPLRLRTANLAGRAVLQLVDDTGNLQLVQIGVLDGETVDGAEHFQPDGLAGVSLPGAEAVVLFPNGDRSHPLVVVTSDRRYRPTGGQPGDRTLYNVVNGATGCRVTLLSTGDIEIQPAPGGKVFVRDAGGTAHPVITKADFDGHTHPAGTLAAPNGAVTGATGGAAAATGSTKLSAQ